MPDFSQLGAVEEQSAPAAPATPDFSKLGATEERSISNAYDLESLGAVPENFQDNSAGQPPEINRTVGNNPLAPSRSTTVGGPRVAVPDVAASPLDELEPGPSKAIVETGRIGGRALGMAGRVTKAAVGDIEEAPAQIAGYQAPLRNLRQYATDTDPIAELGGVAETPKPLPFDVDTQKRQGIDRFLRTLSSSLAQMEPRLAAGFALGATGAPEAISAGLPMLVTDEGSYDPIGAAIAMGIPGVQHAGEEAVAQWIAKSPVTKVMLDVLGRDPLKIKGKVEQELGGIKISSDDFRKFLEQGGGFLASNAYLAITEGGLHAEELAKMTPAQRGQWTLDMVAQNIAPALLGFVRPGLSKSLEYKAPEIAPKLAEIVDELRQNNPQKPQQPQQPKPAVTPGDTDATTTVSQPGGLPKQPQGTAPVGQTGQAPSAGDSVPGATGQPPGTPPQAPSDEAAVKAATIAKRIAAGIKPEHVQITVNKQPDMPAASYVQVDEVHPELGNTFSSNPDALRKAGFDMPDTRTLMQLPSGKWWLPEAHTYLQQMSLAQQPTSMDFQGLPLVIENKAGTVRAGKGAGEKPWAVTMPADYGYVAGTRGKDGDEVDVYVGPNHASPKVYVFDQMKPQTGKHDEHKAFLGFDNPAQAAQAFHEAFSDKSAVDRFGGAREMTVDEFKQWVKSPGTKKPVAPPVAPIPKNFGFVPGPNTPPATLSIVGKVESSHPHESYLESTRPEEIAAGTAKTVKATELRVFTPNGKVETILANGHLHPSIMGKTLGFSLYQDIHGRMWVKEINEKPTQVKMPPVNPDVGNPPKVNHTQSNEFAVLKSRLEYAEARGVKVAGIRAYVTDLENGAVPGEGQQPTIADTIKALNLAIEKHEKNAGPVGPVISKQQRYIDLVTADGRKQYPLIPESFWTGPFKYVLEKNVPHFPEKMLDLTLGLAEKTDSIRFVTNTPETNAIDDVAAIYNFLEKAHRGGYLDSVEGHTDELRIRVVDGDLQVYARRESLQSGDKVNTGNNWSSSIGSYLGISIDSLRDDRAAEAIYNFAKQVYEAAFDEDNPQPKGDPELRKIIVSPDDNHKKAAQIKKLATARGLTVKQAQELIESEIVQMVDEIARDEGPERGGKPRLKMAQITAIYNRQPLLSARTSGSVERQAYSTPAPLSFALAHATGVSPATEVYDSTAGNGMMLIGGNLANSQGNEIDPERAEALRKFGIGTVTTNDGRTYVPSAKFTVVKVNPPFGTIPNVNYGGYSITKLEHLISLKALEAMADDGTAALVLGAKMEEGNSGKGAQWVFENYLYGHYHVVGNFEVSGDLYGKQGAKWPVRVIVISGRRVNPLAGELAPKTVDRLNTWEEVWGRAESIRNEIEKQRQALGTGGAPGISLPAGGAGTTPANPAGVPGVSGGTTIPPAGGSQPPASGGGGPPASGGTSGGGPRKPAGRPDGKPKNPTVVVSNPSGGGGSAPGVETGDGPPVVGTGNAPGGSGSGGSATGSGELPPSTSVGDKPVTEGNLAGLTDDEVDSLIDGAMPPKPGAVQNVSKEAWLEYINELEGRGPSAPTSQKPKAPKSPPSITDITKLGIEGLGDVQKGLDDLFGGGGMLGTFLPFNEKTYEKAKPHFYDAFQKFKAAGRSLKELFQHLVSRYGEKIRPYIKKFVQELRDLLSQNKPIVPKEHMWSNGEVTAAKTPPKVKSTEYQIPYVPGSEAPPFQTLSPRNIATGSHEAVAKLKERVGSLDEYVSNALGLTKEEVMRVFSGEQVDGVALAIDKFQNGGALIIGDQTGFGKGRQAAAAIRYAIQQGMIPVFFTKDPKLFSDMYGDLKDILTDIKPMIFGDPGKASIVDTDGNVIHQSPAKRKQDSEMRRIQSGGWEDSGYNAMFVTYSQVNNRNDRQLFLEQLAQNNPTLLIMDEAHEAAGDAESSMQAAFISGGIVKRGSGADREQIPVPGLLNANGTKHGQGGVMYLSATFAKRPDNMPVYFRTSLSKAADSFDDVVDAMKRGGVALQQAVSEALAKAGEFLRRERDFTGVSYDMVKLTPKDPEALIAEVDQVTDVLSEIVEFSHRLVDKIKDAGGKGTALSQASIDAQEFAAIVHNQISQLLLGAKADEVVAMVIKAKEKGEKPVIALTNTMESFLNGYTNINGIRPGQPITLRWNELLKYALSRTLRATVKHPNGDSEIVIVDPADYGLAEAYAAVLRLAQAVETKFPVSPIDYIIQKLAKAGVKMYELTGRESGIEYADFEKGTGIYRVFKKANKNTVVNGFNAEDGTGMLLNASGSTGLSAHASVKVKCQQPRHMYIVQPHLDINVFIQTLGRIFRTGMVMLGKDDKGQPYGAKYSHLVLPLQAELKPAAVAARKMKSLNANTTAEADNAIKIDSEDLFNKYGDRVVTEWLDQHPEAQMGTGLLIDHKRDGSPKVEPDVARKFASRMALRPDADQKTAFDQIIANYRELVEQLKATGDYDLEIIVHEDWDGIRVSDDELVPAQDASNILTGGVRVQKWEVKDNRHVPTGEEMQQEFERKTGGAAKLASTWNTLMEKTVRAFDAKDVELHRKEDEAQRALNGAQTDAERAKAQGELALAQGQLTQLAVTRGNWDGTRQTVSHILSDAGRVVELTNNDTGDAYQGMLVDVKWPTGVRVSPSMFRFRFAIDAPGGVLYLSASEFGPDGWALDRSDKSIDDLTGRRAGQRYQRWFITGNPIRGYSASGGRGKLVRFRARAEENATEGEVITGLQMPNNWGPDNLAKDPRLDLVNGIAASHFLTRYGEAGYRNHIPIKSGDIVTIVREFGSQRSYQVSTSAARRTGGKVYLDPEVRRITGDFNKVGNRMVATVDERRLPAVVEALQKVTRQRFRPVGERDKLIPQVAESNRRGQRQGKIATRTVEVPMQMGGKSVILTPPGQSQASLSAYHGTPHEVDKFSTAKIGTGEGAAAYGWGLYFAEKPEVSRTYAEKLAANKYPSEDQLTQYFKPGNIVKGYVGQDRVIAFDWNDGNWKVTVEQVKKNEQGEWVKSGPVRSHMTAPSAKDLTDASIQGAKGNLYTVTLDVEPSDLLAWDKPLSAQSDKVKSALERIGFDKESHRGWGYSGMELYRYINGNRGGENMPHAVRWFDDAEKASRYLLDAGIAGIRYADQGSRTRHAVSVGKGESGRWFVLDNLGDKHWYDSEAKAKAEFDADVAGRTHNYVIFDDSKIHITAKNGERVTPTEAAQASRSSQSVEENRGDVVTAKGVDELRAALPTSGLGPKQQELIGAFLDGPLGNMLPRLTVQISDAIEHGWSGSYFQNLAEIVRNSDDLTGIHELLHPIWEILPDDVKEEFERMRVETLKVLLEESAGQPERQRAIKDLIENPSAGGEDYESRKYPRTLMEELYRYSSAEEFFTHSGSERFAKRVGSMQQGFWARVKQFVSDFIAAVKKAFKLKQSQKDWLDNILNGRFDPTMEDGLRAQREEKQRQASLSKEEKAAIKELASEQGQDDLVATQVFGETHYVFDRPQITPETIASSSGLAKEMLETSGFKVSEQDVPDDDSMANRKAWIMQPRGKDMTTEGKALIERLKKEIGVQDMENVAADRLANILNSVVINFELGKKSAMHEMDQPTRLELYAIAQTERSSYGIQLGALAGYKKDLVFIGRNVDVELGRFWNRAFGGDAIRGVTDDLSAEVERLKGELGVAELTNEQLRKALDDALAQKSKRLVRTMGSGTRIGKRILELIKSGKVEMWDLLKAMAVERGWKVPTDEELRQMKGWADELEHLQELTAKESAVAGTDKAELARLKREKVAVTDARQAELRKQIETKWTRFTKSLSVRTQTGRANLTGALAEYVSANLLLKVGFATRQTVDVLTQGFIHTPTRAIQHALAIHYKEAKAGRRHAGNVVELWKEVGDSLAQAYVQRTKALRAALSATGAVLRRSEAGRNFAHLLDRISIFDRAMQKADEMSAQGKTVESALLRLFTHMRWGYRIAQAMDNLHGVPAVYQEMRQQVVAGLREQGLTRAEADVKADWVMGDMQAEFIRALPDAQNTLEENGVEADEAAVKMAAWRLVTARQYERMRTLRLAADDFEGRARELLNTVGWNLPEKGGLGGFIADILRGGQKLAAQWGPMGIPIVTLTRFGNAMGILINRKLSFTPMGFFPGMFGVNERNIDAETGIASGGSPWYRTEEDRRQRKVEATIGSSVGIGLLLLAASGAIRVLLSWPKDKAEKEKWDQLGWKPGQVHIPTGSDTYITLSMNTGPFVAVSPWLAAGGSIHDLLDGRQKQQAALNTRAAKLGIEAGKVRPISVSDLVGTGASAMWGAITSGRTISGLVGSVSDYGGFNVTKGTASVLSSLTAGLPGVQELARMQGVVLDAKMATVWDFMLPLPSSPAAQVNVLGDRVGSANEAQRVIQTLTGGNYPFPVNDKERPMGEAYRVMFETGFRPPAIQPDRAYDIDGELRPMTADELERFTQLRGQYLKDELSQLGTGATVEEAKSAYQRANGQALAEIGVRTPSRAGVRKTTGGITASRGAAGAIHQRGVQSMAGMARPAVGGFRAPGLKRAVRGKGGLSRGPRLSMRRVGMKRR